MLLSHHKNAGQNHDVSMANGKYENVPQFKYVGNNNISEFGSGRN
jgi:hypothetical protein